MSASTSVKQFVDQLAESKGLTVSAVRYNETHVYFIKRGGRVLHDQAFDFDEVTAYLNHYVGESRHENEQRGNGR